MNITEVAMVTHYFGTRKLDERATNNSHLFANLNLIIHFIKGIDLTHYILNFWFTYFRKRNKSFSLSVIVITFDNIINIFILPIVITRYYILPSIALPLDLGICWIKSMGTTSLTFYLIFASISVFLYLFSLLYFSKAYLQSPF